MNRRYITQTLYVLIILYFGTSLGLSEPVIVGGILVVQLYPVYARTLSLRVFWNRAAKLPASHPMYSQIQKHLSRLIGRVGIPHPDVCILNSAASNAYASAMRGKHQTLYVTTGLAKSFSASDLDAVLGHELGHLAHNDIWWREMGQGVVNAMAFLFGMSDILRHVPVWHVFSAVVFTSSIGTILLAQFSKWQEYRADAFAANLVGVSATSTMLERFRSSALSGNDGRLMSEHPSLQNRIERLNRL